MANELISIERLSDYNDNLLRDANILKRKTAYVLDSIVNKGQIYLKCIQAGTTDTVALPLTNIDIGDELTDGSVKWEVVSINGIPQGNSEVNVIKDTLWSGFVTSATTLNLTHDYSEYDYIAVSVGEGQTHSVHILSTATGSRLDISTYYPIREQYSYSCRITFSGSTAQLESVIAGSSGYGIFRIEGIKFINHNVYSTTEQRIGTWIDGKPLYQITMDGYVLTSSNSYTSVYDLSSLNIDKVVAYDVCTYNANTGTIYCGNATESNSNLLYFINNLFVLTVLQSGWTDYTVRATFKYTKATV